MGSWLRDFLRVWPIILEWLPVLLLKLPHANLEEERMLFGSQVAIKIVYLGS